jgi:hypothetical protein
VSADTYDFMELAGWADDGVMPIAGGSLDQTCSFLEAYRFLKWQRGTLDAEAAR